LSFNKFVISGAFFPTKSRSNPLLCASMEPNAIALCLCLPGCPFLLHHSIAFPFDFPPSIGSLCVSRPPLNRNDLFLFQFRLAIIASLFLLSIRRFFPICSIFLERTVFSQEWKFSSLLPSLVHDAPRANDYHFDPQSPASPFPTPLSLRTPFKTFFLFSLVLPPERLNKGVPHTSDFLFFCCHLQPPALQLPQSSANNSGSPLLPLSFQSLHLMPQRSQRSPPKVALSISLF